MTSHWLPQLPVCAMGHICATPGCRAGAGASCLQHRVLKAFALGPKQPVLSRAGVQKPIRSRRTRQALLGRLLGAAAVRGLRPASAGCMGWAFAWLCVNARSMGRDVSIMKTARRGLDARSRIRWPAWAVLIFVREKTDHAKT